MNVQVFPIKQLHGSLHLPASKSYSVRAFMIAACGGRSCIINSSSCYDALAAVSVARQLGAVIVRDGKCWKVTAGAGRQRLKYINVKESGTVLRMLLPLVALRNMSAVVGGEGTLKGRPNLHLIRTLQSLGIDVKGEGPGHGIPISFRGGLFRGGRLMIDGSLSSQFVSALLMACPQIREDSFLKVSGKTLVSLDYITMTLQVLEKAGIVIEQRNARTYVIKGGQKYRGLKSFHVPSDYGLAAFLLVAAALLKSDVVLRGALNDEYVQADGAILPILRKMGVMFQKTSRSFRLKGPFVLKGGIFSLRNCPDLLPVLSIAALFAEEACKFIHIEHVRAKESDRITDLRKELLKTGARVQEGRDFLVVHPLKERECKQNVVLDAHHDHRLAMAFCVLGLRIGVKVKDVECVAKSYPDFLKDLACLGAILKEY